MATASQNYNFPDRLCHASVTDVVYPLFNDFGLEIKKHRQRVKTEDQMNGSYHTAKFLANERVNDQRANARDHRLAQKSVNGQNNKSILNNIRPALSESKQRLIHLTSQLAGA